MENSRTGVHTDPHNNIIKLWVDEGQRPKDMAEYSIDKADSLQRKVLRSQVNQARGVFF